MLYNIAFSYLQINLFLISDAKNLSQHFSNDSALSLKELKIRKDYVGPQIRKH